MKLWTTVHMERLPHIFQNGLDNPLSEEIQFHNTSELVAEWAMESEEDYPLAFIEVDFPEEEIDEWFTYCIASVSDTTSDAESSLEYDIESGVLAEEDIEEARAYVEALKNIETGSQNLEVLGYACLYHVVPPEMLKLLDPATMFEAVYTGDIGAVAEAVETAEVQSFETLGAGFWVWLIFFMSQLLGPNWGTAVEEHEAVTKAEARKKRRRTQKKRKGKRKARTTT